MTQARPFTTTKPPPIESLVKAYFTPLMSPLPVVTRLRQPAPNADTITEYLRIQAAGGPQLVTTGQEGYFWQCSLILHSYAPADQEVLAEENMTTAVGWGANAQGTTIVTRSGVPWYCSYSTGQVGTKIIDPSVALVRYRGLATWRIMGRPM